MKLVPIAIVLFALALLALFLTAVISPGRSRKLQEWIRQWPRKGEERASNRGRSTSERAARLFAKSARATDRTGERGRRIHHEITRTDEEE